MTKIIGTAPGQANEDRKIVKDILNLLLQECTLLTIHAV